MKEILKQYAAYNVWANQRIFDVVKSLNNDLLNQSIASSFPSVIKTLLHIYDAESIWWQRLKLVEHITRPSESSYSSIHDIVSQISAIDNKWLEWISSANEAAIVHVFAYQNSKKEQFKQPVFQMILHLFNHTTYHRGQLVTMFHQLNVTKIPSTDFIEWSRNAKGIK